MTNDSRVAAALLAVTSGWLLLSSTVTTYLLSAGVSPRLALPFRLICHGIDKRSLRLWETPMPVCARCFGIYLGLAAGLLIFLAGYRFLQHPMPLPALAGCILPLALDGTTQALLLRESTNSLRLATGVLAGTGFLLWALIHIELNGRRNVNRLKFETVRAAEDS